MQIRVLFAAGLLVLAFQSALAEPKAYEVVKYKGKAEGVTIILEYGDGYPEASHMRVTKRGKTTEFVLHDTGELHFVPKKQNGAKREVALKLGMDEQPGTEIAATYTVDGKQTQFTLRRVE